MATTAIIVIGGDPPPPEIIDVLPADRFVIAADSGYDHALALGITVDLLVGDLDSISVDGLHHARTHGVQVEVHPANKDATDTELAITSATSRGFVEITGIFGGGDRLDHALAVLFAFAAPNLAGHRVTLWWGDTRIVVLHDGDDASPYVAPGEPFTLLPLHGAAGDVDIAGAVYPLDHAILDAGSSLGVSNLAGPAPARVRLGHGTIAHVTPRALVPCASGGNP